MRKAAIFTLCTLFLTAAVTAEEAKKPLSPPAKAEAKIKGKQVTIDYSAPSKRDRVIMGELVPYGQVWRTGANAATTLTTESNLMLGTLHVPPGTYTLYTIPGEKEWTLIVNKETGQWGTKYDETQDLGRTKMNVAPKLAQPVETFNISVDDKKLAMQWENTKVWVPVMAH
jgi:hypothetical protein